MVRHRARRGEPGDRRTRTGLDGPPERASRLHARHGTDAHAVRCFGDGSLAMRYITRASLRSEPLTNHTVGGQTMTVHEFAAVLEQQQRERIAREYPNIDLTAPAHYRAAVHVGPKYTKV